jgi:serine/threonine-protein kinase
MAYIPGGEFLMGSNDGDELERPQHKVTVKPFFIDLYEVTCEDYEKFVKATNHRPPPSWKNQSYPPGAARKPVTGVDWDDANAYARWAGKRLPTEEEWEFAARGSDGRRYPWGNEWNSSAANAEKTNINAKASGDIVTLEYMTNVGQYPDGKSPFGVYDMIGNAWEWTATKLTSYDGSPLPKELSNGDKIFLGPVIRGGCYYLGGRNRPTTTYRRGYPPRGVGDYKNTSFRCVKDVTI